MKIKLSSQDNVLGQDTAARVAPHGIGLKRIGLIFLLAGWLGPLPLSAQTNAPKSSSPPNRYLLVVETSRAIKSRSEGVYHAVQALLITGMGGQAHRGDTIGLWTFNDEVYAGGLPLQQWSPEGVRSLVAKTMNFVTDQKFEKGSRFEKVLPVLARVVHDSEYITVILVTDGSQKLQGTPFDTQINEAYKSWRSEQQEAHMPFITVLRGKRGKLTDYTVNPAQWPLDMPPLPPELVPAEAKSAPAVTKAPPSVGPSLYLYGKTKSNTPLPPESRPPTETTPPLPSLTPEAGASAIKPAANATVTRLEPAPVVADPGLSESTRINTAGPGPVRPAPDSIQLPPANPPAASLNPAAPPLAVSQTPVPEPAVPSPTPAAPEPVSAPLASEPQSKPEAVVTHAPTAPVATAVALPSESPSNRRLIVIAGSLLLLLLLVGGAFLVKAMKRSRAISHASLITRSLDRTSKE